MTETSAPGTAVNVGGTDATRPRGFLGPEAMLSYLSEALEARLLDSVVAYGQLTIIVDPDAWVDAVRLCKEDPKLNMRFWEFLDAVDRGDEGFDCVAHIYSVEHHHDVTLRTRVPGGRENPTMPSLTQVFRGANWSERETFDMFGIEFEGHPGVRPRILTVENFEGWPLRKDFQLTSRNVKPWPGAKEPGEPGGGEDAADPGAVAAGAPAAEPQDRAAAAKEKAERAKAKAAEMRAKKAAERAHEQSAAAGGASVEDQAVASDAQRTTDDEATAAASAEPGSDLIADSVDQFGGGDTEDEAAAAAATAGGDPTASTPEGAAEVSGSSVAKDAAAGVPQGDVAAGAPQDEAGTDEPVVDAEAEAEAAQGASAEDSGTPGVEAEGRHGGAEIQSGARPAAETPGMTSETQGLGGAPLPQEDDVPVVPAQGSAAAPLATDRSPDEAEDERHGLERETLGVDDDTAGEPSAQAAEGGSGSGGATQERVEEGPSPHPSPSERTDAADRADPNRDLASDATVEDEGEQR